MARSGITTSKLQRTTLAVLLLCAVLALLIYGSDFLVPIVIAALLASLFSSLIIRLQKLGMPEWLATAGAIVTSIVALFLVGLVFRDQMSLFEKAWPQYSSRIDGIFDEVTALVGPDVAGYLRDAIAGIDLAKPVAGLASSAGGVLGDIVLVLLYMSFLLGERGVISTKLQAMVPNSRDSMAVDEIVQSVLQGIRRYLSVKTMISLLTAVLCYVVLKLYGVHFAELLAFLIFVLNYIPFIGSAIAIIIPSILALLQFETLGLALQIPVWMGAVQFLVGNVIEPRFTGKTLNLSTFVVLASLTFWSMIWGAMGAFLSVPITASLVIICRNFPSTRWLAVLCSADGRPETPDEPMPMPRTLPWPFGRSTEESEELQALRKELDEMKAQQAQETRADARTKQAAPAKRRSRSRAAKPKRQT